MRRGSHLLG